VTTIFISYRRDDEPAAAGRLYDALVAALGARSVFIDVDGIKPGVDFVEVLEEVLSRCDVLVAVVGRRWLEARDAEGRLRLADPEDFVRLELIRALERSKEHGDIRLLPLCVEGARMPRPDELPPELASFARLQAFSLRHVTWRSDVEHLLEWLQAQAPEETWATRARRRLGLSTLSRRAARLVAAAAALAAAAGVAAVVLAVSGGKEQPQGIGEVSGAPTPLQGKPTAIAAGAGAIWVAEINGVVEELDPQTGHVRGTPIRVPGAPLGLAVGEGAVWVACRTVNSDGEVRGQVVDIDPASKQVGRAIGVGAQPRDVAIGAGAVWTANFSDGSVSRIDPRSRRERRYLPKRPDIDGEPADIAVGEGAVWVVESKHQTLNRISSATGAVLARIPVSAAPESVVVGVGSVWVASLSKDTVTKIDPKTNQPVGQPVVVGSHPDDMAIWRGALYVAAKDEGVVQRIDPRSLSLSHDSISVGNGPDALAVYGDSLWVSNVDDSSAVRIAE
jgi:DNA-binding beta-propeller fold protein YncE